MNYTDFSKTTFYKYSDLIENLEEKYSEGENWELFSNIFENWYNNLKGKKVSNPIPKKIHQIWIGSELPSKYNDWCASWKKFNPDWEYKLWNEEDILSILSPEKKKAFLESTSFGPKGDIARYAILEQFGGVYCDTDFECTMPLDEITDSCTLFAANIFSNIPEIAGGIMGSIPNHPMVHEVSLRLENPVKSTNSKEILLTSGPAFLTRVLEERKDLLLPTDVFFPSHYFYPYPNFQVDKNKSPAKVKKEFLKPVSYGIHWWEVSWEKRDFMYYFKKIVKVIIFYKYWKK